MRAIAAFFYQRERWPVARNADLAEAEAGGCKFRVSAAWQALSQTAINTQKEMCTFNLFVHVINLELFPGWLPVVAIFSLVGEKGNQQYLLEVVKNAFGSWLIYLFAEGIIGWLKAWALESLLV